MIKKYINIILFLLLGGILSGCGGGGGNPNNTPPTSANLRSAGEQIVVDTREVWGYSSEEKMFEPKFLELINNTRKIQWYTLADAINRASWGVEFDFYKKLFRLPPGQTYNEEDVYKSSGTGIFNEGSWRVNSDEGSFVLDITRSTNNIMDTIEYDVTNTVKLDISYHGDVSYSTSFLTSYQEGSNVTVEITMSNSNLATSVFNGTYEQIKSGDLKVHGNFNGTFDFNFKDGPKVNYEGTIIVPEDVDADNGDELVMEGVLETPYIKMEGDIKTFFIENLSAEHGYVPNKLSLQGKIQSIDNKYSLDGNLSVEAKNAAQFDPEQDQSVSNCANLKVSFGGSFVNDGSGVETNFAIEEVEFKRYKFDVVHKFRSSQGERSCSVGIAQTGTGFHMDVNSTWGPATISLDATNDADGNVSGVTGNVAVNGTQVGTIKLDNGLMKVEYNDGSFETF